MTGCEEFEMAIEMRGRGALGAERSDALEAHLEGCASCRRYQALVRRTEETMAAQTMSAPSLESLEKMIAQQHERVRTRAWLPVIMTALIAAALVVITGNPKPVLISLGIGAATLFALFRLRASLMAREAAKVARTQADFLAHYRSLLERRIRLIRGLSVLTPIFFALELANIGSGKWPASMRNGAAYAVILVPLGAACVFTWYLRLKISPVLEREKRDLGGA